MAAKILKDEIYEQVELISETGNDFADDEEYAAAIEKFKEALALVPEPKHEWEAGTWLYQSIGNMYFMLDDYENAAKFFADAILSQEGKINSFNQMRLGQASLEMKQEDKALEHLLKAYRMGGKKLFAEEDTKYLAFLGKRVKL